MDRDSRNTDEGLQGNEKIEQAVQMCIRDSIKNGTELGQKAKKYMDQGLLVPDELTCDLVMDRIGQEDCKMCIRDSPSP